MRETGGSGRPRLLYINNCLNCPHKLEFTNHVEQRAAELYHGHILTLFCKAANRPIVENILPANKAKFAGIPEWCPLTPAAEIGVPEKEELARVEKQTATNCAHIVARHVFGRWAARAICKQYRLGEA